MTTIEGFREYAGLVGLTDGAIDICYDAAIQAARDAGISDEIIMEDAKASLYVYSMASYWYDNRGFTRGVSGGNDAEIERLKTKMRQELKYKSLAR